jgi:uncharacterized protein
MRCCRINFEGGITMAEDKPGPEPGSEGARKIAEAHRGSHAHDREGGFAANPELAREAGRKGGQTVKQKYGQSFYRQIGKKGGETVKKERGSDFYAEIGRRGGEMRSSRMKAAKAEVEKSQAKKSA